MRSRRTLAVSTMALSMLFAVPTAAMAGDVVAHSAPVVLGYTEEPAVTTTEGPSSGLTPAVEAPAPEDDKDDQPWTARFLAPLVLLLGLAALAASISYYAIRIKRRYRVVN